MESKIRELIENPKSIIVHTKYVNFVSNNINTKLFHNEEIIKKIMLNNDDSIENINRQFIKSSYHVPMVKLFIDFAADIHVLNDNAIINAS